MKYQIKVEFDKDEQNWRLTIPSEYTRTGKPEVKFFRSVDWVNEAVYRIEASMAPTSPQSRKFQFKNWPLRSSLIKISFTGPMKISIALLVPSFIFVSHLSTC